MTRVFQQTAKSGGYTPIPVPGPDLGPFGDDTCKGLFCPQPTRPWTPWDDQIAEVWGMCKRALGGGGGGGNDDEADCDQQLAEEQKYCASRINETALPGMYSACMTRTYARYAACRAGKDGPNRWSKDDEQVWRNPNR